MKRKKLELHFFFFALGEVQTECRCKKHIIISWWECLKSVVVNICRILEQICIKVFFIHKENLLNPQISLELLIALYCWTKIAHFRSRPQKLLAMNFSIHQRNRVLDSEMIPFILGELVFGGMKRVLIEFISYRGPDSTL